MNSFSKKLGVAALVLFSMAGVAQAGDDFGDDDYGSGYRRQSLSRLCYKYPEDARCEPRAYRPRPKRHYSGGYNGSCAATIRAAGKRNLIGAFARNAAIFAWQREVRAVHGGQYASWGAARNTSISCGPAGGALTGCVANATPCRS